MLVLIYVAKNKMGKISLIRLYHRVNICLKVKGFLVLEWVDM